MQRWRGLSSDDAMIFPRAFYFFYYAGTASLVPFLALYYAQLGLSGPQIGLLSGTFPFITLLSASLWGGLADATQRHRALLILAMAGTLVCALALSQVTGFFGLFAVVVIFALFAAPVIPLVDNTVVEALGQRRGEYGRQRLWGAVGWGLAAPIAGAAIDRTSLLWSFTAFLILMSGALLVATRLPVAQARLGAPFSRGLLTLLTNWRWIVFLVTVLVGFLSLSMVLSFLFLYLEELGASKTLMGISLTVATASELPVWFYSDRLLARWGTRGVLTLALLACGAQALAFSVMRSAWLVLPIQLLQGPAFSAMWSAGVAYANEAAPEGMGATAQGLFSGVGMGLRSALGAVIGGALYDGVGPVLMFRWGAVSALLGLLFFLLAGARSESGH